MNLYLEVISEFRPKNGLSFAIADVNDLRGGYIQVETIEEMNSFLSTNKLKYGMLCYVKQVQDDVHMFIYRDGNWEIWEGQGGSGGGGMSLVVVEDLAELETKTALQMRGQIIYINSLDDLRFWNGLYWESFRKIYIQDTPPDDKGGIWIDTSEHGFNRSTDVIQDMLKVINILLQKVNRLMYMLTEIDPGDFTNNMSTSQDNLLSERPPYGTSEEEDDETLQLNSLIEVSDAGEPDNLNYSPNTKVLKVKSGTLAYMKAHEEDFAERELLWCYDTQTLWIKDPKTYKLIKIGATGSGSEEEEELDIMDGIIQETISQYKRIVGIEFADMANKSNLYMLRVKDGLLKLIDKTVSIVDTKLLPNADGTYSPMYYPLGEGNYSASQNSPFVYINMVYCGGDDNKYSYNPVSHNFIELCNIARKDLNLNGLYLHYTEGSADPRHWVTLPLTGTIKAGSTFLIRGAACSVYNTNTTIIKVGEPDMYWTKDITKNYLVCDVDTDEEQHSIWDEDGLIKLSRKCSIYLSGGYDKSLQLEYELELVTPFDNSPLELNVPWKSNGVAKYYIDLLGIGSDDSSIIACNTPFNNTKNNMDPKNCLIFRYYNMDPVKLALKAPKDLNNNNNAQWTYFDLSKINENVDILKYVPKNSKQGKNIFFNKADFVEGPNIVTCTFGYDAHKTRCFTWISKDYYDEYIKIWTDNEENAEIYESFKEGDNRDSKNRNWDSPIYNRIRNVATNGVAYTVHKFIMDFPEPETLQKYYYKVGREGFWSTTHSFTIRNRDMVIANGFLWVHVTDQLGFHDEEYKTWGIVSEFIKLDGDTNLDNSYDFIMNTGDLTLNGNRVNEWLAYYRYSSEFYRDKELMFVIGNNDLCSQDPMELGTGEDINKINPENINFFFTYEHPFGIPLTPDGKYIPSVFSFIYGDTYFLGMNSEFTNNTLDLLFNVNSNYVEELGEYIPTGIYARIKTWCDSDLTYIDNKIKWRVAFTHDNPFTLLTKDQIYGKSANGVVTYTYLDANYQEPPSYSNRGGSHLNTVGNYWFSKFLEDNGFRVCIGGHKHTYTCSRPMRDNPNNRMKPFVYDPDYHIENGEPVYPDWYATSGSLREHLMLFGDLMDGNNNEFNYVRYVTLQATGYKTTSNKELPHAGVPWLSNYYPAGSDSINDLNRFTSDTKNSGQNYPHYILWRVGNGTEVTKEDQSTTSRPIILGRVYKVRPVNGSSGWVYTYNIPYNVSLLEKLKANGGTNNTDNIIIEQSYLNE